MAFGRPMHTGYAVIRILELKLETTQPYLAKKLKDFWNQKQILAVKNGGKQREGNKKSREKTKKRITKKMKEVGMTSETETVKKDTAKIGRMER